MSTANVRMLDVGILFSKERLNEQVRLLLLSQVSKGYYTLGGVTATTTTGVVITAVTENNETVGQGGDDTTLVTTRTAERLCEPGFWCEAGVRYPCEAGNFGDEFGATLGNCSGACFGGFVCGNSSVTPEERPCGVSKKRGRRYGSAHAQKKQ